MDSGIVVASSSPAKCILSRKTTITFSLAFLDVQIIDWAGDRS